MHENIPELASNAPKGTAEAQLSENCRKEEPEASKQSRFDLN